MTTLAIPVMTASTSKIRSTGIDRLRGLAILLMFLDHALLVSGLWHSPLRATVTRLAIPLFFIISGHLFRRLTHRHALILAIGILLPLYVSFVDDPNVLAWYVIGCVALTFLPPWLIAGTAFGLGANYATFHLGTSYWPMALVGLMAIGRMIPRETFTLADRLPSFLSFFGRFPLSFYVSHLLILETCVLVLGLPA